MTHPTVIKLHDGNLMPQLVSACGKLATRKSSPPFIRRWKSVIALLTPPPRTKMRPASAMRCTALASTAMSSSSPPSCGTTIKTAARGAEREPQQTEAGLCGSLFNPLAGTGYRPLRRGLAGVDRAAAAGLTKSIGCVISRYRICRS